MQLRQAFLIVAISLSPCSSLAQPVLLPQKAEAPAASTETLATLLVQAHASAAGGDTETAERLLGQALKLSPNSLDANLTLGQLMLDRHRYPEAMERFETVLATNLHSAPARKGELSAAIALALASRRAGNQEAALLCLRHARASLPDDPTLLRDLGIQLYEMRQLAPAAEALTQALALEPREAASVYALARVEVDQQLFPAAERHFKIYLAARPEDASAHYGFGHLLQMQQRIEEATTQFNESIRLQPLQTESYYQLGQMALDEHRDGVAKTLFKRTLSRLPSHGGALTGIGILAFRAKDYAEAAVSLRQATLASPDYQPAHYYLGLTLARLNDREGSTQELRIAADLASKQQGKAAPISGQRIP